MHLFKICYFNNQIGLHLTENYPDSKSLLLMKLKSFIFYLNREYGEYAQQETLRACIPHCSIEEINEFTPAIYLHLLFKPDPRDLTHPSPEIRKLTKEILNKSS